MDTLEDFAGAHPESETINEAIRAAMEKLKAYYSRSDAAVYPIATILDPKAQAGVLPQLRVGARMDRCGQGRFGAHLSCPLHASSPWCPHLRPRRAKAQI